MISRRRFVGFVTSGAAVLLAACSAPAPTPAPTQAPAKPAEAPKPAAAEPAKPAAAEPAKPAAAAEPTKPSVAAAAPAAVAPSGAPTGTVKGALLGAPGRADQMKPLSGRFQDANKGVTAEWLPVAAGSWDEFFGKLVTMFAGGQQLDIIEVALDGVHLFTSRGLVRPLNQLVLGEKEGLKEFFDDVSPRLVSPLMYRGDLYMLPFVWGGNMLYYNPKLFQEAGAALPKDDWTLEQFVDSAKKINAKNKDVLGYGWTNQTFPGLNAWFMLNDTNLFAETKAPGGEWLWNAFYPGNSVASQQGGGYLWGDALANKEKSVEAFQFLVDMIHRDKLSPVPTSNWDDLINLFSAKKIGMIMGHRFMIARFKNAGMTPDDFDVTYHPKWKTQRHQHGVSGWAIAKDAKSPDAAWAMVKWITRKDEGAAWIKGGVQTSARRSVTNAPDQNEGIAPKNWQAYYNVLDKLDAGATPSPADAKEITTVLLKYVSLAGGKEMPVKDALDKLNAELTEIASRTKR